MADEILSLRTNFGRLMKFLRLQKNPIAFSSHSISVPRVLFGSQFGSQPPFSFPNPFGHPVPSFPDISLLVILESLHPALQDSQKSQNALPIALF
jgi:hypothetical protein